MATQTLSENRIAPDCSVLSYSQIEQFIDRGFVVLEEAFPRAQALEVQDFLWDELAERSVLRTDPSTWVKRMVHIKKNYDSPLFGACMTDRLQGAIEDLSGANRSRARRTNADWGWWPVNFAVGADKPWDVPRAGWHWDGHHFRHTLTKPDQGLLLLPHFSEVRPHGGGTVLAAGSHQVVARFLAREIRPVDLRRAIGRLNREHPWLAELTGVTTDCDNRIKKFMDQETVDPRGTRLSVVEVSAQPGDVVICHPFLYHAASANHSGKPRFMCNRTSPLKKPMRLDRPNGDYSPVELSIKRALLS